MTVTKPRLGVGIQRHFTTKGIHPYDEVTWEHRDARIMDHRTGKPAFEQLNVEVPSFWSQNATNILASKYFRGNLGTDERETSLRQVIDRICLTIASWGRHDGYFDDEDEASAFEAELSYLIVHQIAAFNSPVWFNIGVKGVPQQASACFILSVEDSMDSILNWYSEEGIIFKGGSGAGVNLSKIRASIEPLRGGGTASGPVSFMRGADSSAGTIKSGGKTRRAAKMVILDIDHPDIEDFIWCKAIEERKARVLSKAGFDMGLDGKDAYSVQYQNANNSVRITDEFMQAVLEDRDWHLVARTTGEVVKTIKARELFHQIAQAAWECGDPGVQFDDTINAWHTAPSAGRINASNPCSEYMHIDNSACNLASLNLLKFLDEDGAFDVEAFKAATATLIVAQEILVQHADYPTAKIAENSLKYRQLGLGYSNLGAALMALGLPYDSNEGRAWAASVTALMTGYAYATSAKIASRMGPFAGFHDDKTAMLGVLEKHRRAVAEIDESLVDPQLLDAARQAWDEACDLGYRFGVRNAQATVLAPTGTISLLMDCDTTGIEPDLSLVKTKQLVGGGSMTTVNQTLGRALAALGYSSKEAADIISYVKEHGSILGAPHLSPKHLPVFATSMGDNSLSYKGHLSMMAACQPFISGAISKTINLPEQVSTDEIENLYLEAWKMGLKAVAIYRDNCKVDQPLGVGSSSAQAASSRGASPSSESSDDLAQKVAELEQALERQTVVVKKPVRERLPRKRRSSTFAFRVADCEGYVTVGEYADGRPGEVFMKVSKQGSTLAGVMDAFSIAVSLGLQHGVPLSTFVRKYTNMRFEPAGITDDPDLRIASSLVDYIFRRLAVDYLSYEERAELGVLTSAERTQQTLPGLEEMTTPNFGIVETPSLPSWVEAASSLQQGVAPVEHGSISEAKDAPYCYECGNAMVRSGSCYVCPSCGSTSGCS